MTWSKFVTLLNLSLKHISLNKSYATSITIPLATIIAVVSAVTFYMEGVERDAMLAASTFPDILVQQQVGGRTESLYFDRYEDVLRKIPEITAFSPRVWGHVNYVDKDNNARAFVLMGLDPKFLGSDNSLQTVIRDGRSLAAGDTNQALIGEVVANAFGARAGDVIKITSPDFRKNYILDVVGTFESDVQIFAADLVIVPIAMARKILGFYGESECSDVLVFVQDSSRIETIAREITQLIDGARPLTKQVMMRLVELSFGQRSGYFHLLWLILLINILIIAWSVMSRISYDRKKEIGILKAIGWDIQDVMILKVLEVFVVSCFSVFCGLLAGVMYMLADAPGLKRFIIGWTDIYPDFPIPLYIEWQTVFFIAVLGILPLTVATLIPIWKASLVDPVEALR